MSNQFCLELHDNAIIQYVSTSTHTCVKHTRMDAPKSPIFRVELVNGGATDFQDGVHKLRQLLRLEVSRILAIVWCDCVDVEVGCEVNGESNERGACCVGESWVVLGGGCFLSCGDDVRMYAKSGTK